MVTDQELKDRIFGENGWTAHNIHVRNEIWTKPGEENGNKSTLEKVITLVKCLSDKPLHQLKVLDLGCLEGIYSVELARLGCDCLGIEGREVNYDRCRYVEKILELPNLHFELGDVRSLLPKQDETFDLVLCLGLFYHFKPEELFTMTELFYQLTNRILIIDTCVSQVKQAHYSYKNQIYSGHLADEPIDASDNRRFWAALEPGMSLYLNEDSIKRLLETVGFKIVMKVLIPSKGHKDKITFVALKECL